MKLVIRFYLITYGEQEIRVSAAWLKTMLWVEHMQTKLTRLNRGLVDGGQ